MSKRRVHETGHVFGIEVLRMLISAYKKEDMVQRGRKGSRRRER